MTPTREQMELAARATELPLGDGVGEFHWSSPHDCLVRRNANGTSQAWRPTLDGNDSQRLQVKLRIGVLIDGAKVISASTALKVVGVDFNHAIEGDDLRAMQEAIFLVAVEIGSAK